MARYIYKKLADGRGRPTKFVEQDDGTIVPYKEYELKFGKLPESDESTDTSATEPTVDKPLKTVLFNRDNIHKYNGQYIDHTDDGVQYKTKAGSPLKLLGFIDAGTGFKDALVTVGKNDGLTYRTMVSMSDIEPTPSVVLNVQKEV